MTYVTSKDLLSVTLGGLGVWLRFLVKHGAAVFSSSMIELLTGGHVIEGPAPDAWLHIQRLLHASAAATGVAIRLDS